MSDMRQQCETWIENANVRAFLRMLRVGEGTPDEDGYRRHFGGDLFDDFSDHPRRPVTRELGGKPITSTAAGAYQFLASTWDGCRKALGLEDFSPPNQDLAAVYLIHGRRAIEDILEGRIEEAVSKCAKEWASLPGSPYGQPVKTLDDVLGYYASYGGHLAGEPVTDAAPAAPAKENPMPAASIIAAVLPSIIEAIPALGRLFGSGSKVSERNIKAAEIAVGIVKEATGAANEQAAAEAVTKDTALRDVATKAIESRWRELTEVGGGIDAARKADAAMVDREGPWWQVVKSPSFLVSLMLLPLVYLLVLSLIGVVGSATWSDDVRAGLAGSIVSAIIGGLVGYYYGQTTSRNRATQVS